MSERRIEEHTVLLNKLKDDTDMIIYPVTKADAIVDFEDKVPAVVNSIMNPTTSSPMAALEIKTGTLNENVMNALLV